MSNKYGVVSAALITKTQSRKKCIAFSGIGLSLVSVLRNNVKDYISIETLHVHLKMLICLRLQFSLKYIGLYWSLLFLSFLRFPLSPVLFWFFFFVPSFHILFS